MNKVLSIRLPEEVIEWVNEASILCKKSPSTFAKDIIISSYSSVREQVMYSFCQLSIKNEELLQENKRMEQHLNAVNNNKKVIDFAREANTISQSNKISRNAPCPCGSGKKYKKCCGLTAELDKKGRDI